MVNLEITSCHCAWAYLIHSPRKQTCVCVFWGVILLYVMLLRFSKHQKEKFCDGRKKVCVCVCVCDVFFSSYVLSDCLCVFMCVCVCVCVCVFVCMCIYLSI